MASSIEEILKLGFDALQENDDSSLLDEFIQQMNDRIEMIDFPKEFLSLLVLLNRIVLLAKEKCSDIEFAKFDDEELHTLQQQIQEYERETIKQKAELEIWKYQADMMHKIKLQDDKNIKYVKTQYRKDMELLS